MKETLWTIQSEAAFELFLKTGVFRADLDQLFFNDRFRNAYDWMADQMIQRIGPSPVGVQYPVWAWYQWEGKRKRRDLRQSGYAKRGSHMVQITFEADPKDFLLSDFDLWHAVLNNHYIADSEQDWNRFYTDSCDRSAEIIASWEKIFDMSRYTPGWDTAPEDKSIQATLWEIHVSQVRKVERFIAR